MHQVLRSLVGREISTMTGRTNRILRVDGPVVWVPTKRSPEGRPVDIADVQSAADRLYEDGELGISVKSVGYRSAFVGAVLIALDDTEALLNPRMLRLRR
jgi:hypothetical protein